jgi:hypothetical protein
VAQPVAHVAAALLVEELLEPRAGAAYKRAPRVECARSARVERRVQCRVVAVRLLREERALLLVASIAYVEHALGVRAPDGRQRPQPDRRYVVLLFTRRKKGAKRRVVRGRRRQVRRDRFAQTRRPRGAAARRRRCSRARRSPAALRRAPPPWRRCQTCTLMPMRMAKSGGAFGSRVAQ